MLHIKDYIQSCMTLSVSQEAKSFTRSEFDYSNRQRRSVKGYDTFSVNLILEWTEMKKFQEFWDDLNQGTATFQIDQIIHGDASANKIVRYISPYQMKELGGNQYQITTTLEKVRVGQTNECPLTPSTVLTPGMPLVPCGNG